MDEETQAGFEEMRRGFEEMRRGFAAIDRRFDAVDQRFVVIDQRFAATDGDIRGLGVINEDLRTKIEQVAEGVRGNEQAIERLRTEMNERFLGHEIVVRAAFGQIRRDIDELRDRR